MYRMSQTVQRRILYGSLLVIYVFTLGRMTYDLTLRMHGDSYCAFSNATLGAVWVGLLAMLFEVALLEGNRRSDKDRRHMWWGMLWLLTPIWLTLGVCGVLLFAQLCGTPS